MFNLNGLRRRGKGGGGGGVSPEGHGHQHDHDGARIPDTSMALKPGEVYDPAKATEELVPSAVRALLKRISALGGTVLSAAAARNTVLGVCVCVCVCVVCVCVCVCVCAS